MSIISIMAAILEDGLREHGILELTLPDCEILVRSMIERTAELADIKQHQLESYPSGRTCERDSRTMASQATAMLAAARSVLWVVVSL